MVRCALIEQVLMLPYAIDDGKCHVLQAPLRGGARGGCQCPMLSYLQVGSIFCSCSCDALSPRELQQVPAAAPCRRALSPPAESRR